jgi:hypothetical protein
MDQRWGAAVGDPGVVSVRNVQAQLAAGWHDREMVDLDAASEFMAAHARLLDRRRFDVLVRGAAPDGALAALEAYRNPDGGYSWGLEPDLRDTRSQPGPALHAFEVFEDIAPATSPRAVELCDWLQTITLPDGGVPFALPVESRAGCAPFWADADPDHSSLQITAIVTAMAHRAARHHPGVAAHPWLQRATDYCVQALEAEGEQAEPMALAFAFQALDAARRPESEALIDRLGARVPEGGMKVVGGSPDEYMRPLDFTPLPGGPVRRLFGPAVIDAELDRLQAGQEADGGWRVDFASYSPAAELEWRGHMTVNALGLLKRNGRP